MEIVITEDPQGAAEIAADAICRLLDQNPRSVLGLATGSSPLPTYSELINRHRRGLVSFAVARAFLLDEYVGLAPDHPEAYRTFIERELVSQVDLPLDALAGPDGSDSDDALDGADDSDDSGLGPSALATAPDRYEALIAEAGGIDLQLLGIGGDGHIGFNEPTSSFGSRTRLKTLTDDTRTDNARFFDNDVSQVPRHVLTQGIGTILEARHLVLVATGQSKAAPVAKAVEGPLTSMVPATALQLHPHATVIIDEPAATELSHTDYYRQAYDNKPIWQHI